MTYPGRHYSGATRYVAIMKVLARRFPYLDSIHIEQCSGYMTESDVIRIIRSFQLKSWSSDCWKYIDADYTTTTIITNSSSSEIKNTQIRELLASSSSTLEELILSNMTHLHGQDLIAILSQCPNLRKLSITDGFEYNLQTKTGVSVEELVDDFAPAWVCSNLEYLHISIVDVARTTKYIEPFEIDSDKENEEEQRQRQHDIEMAQRLLQLFRKLETLKNLRNVRLHWRFPLMETTRDYIRKWRKNTMEYDLPLSNGMKQILMQTLGKEHMLWMNLRWEVGAPWHRTREELKVNEIEDESDNTDYRCCCCRDDGFYELDDMYDPRNFIEEAYDLHKSRNRHHSRSDRKFLRFQKKAK
ncbi:hypothetical protein BGZ80_000688 [Entomortierella chlamydospora]|uniref:Uncharacterized protein n=1 Tax=Entomortierella chlamydospora TaxID=101097 RepID=A0A9P6MSR7_9FUNG|nr:hypothetical protein BGZ80_000688 [Entomortierella chlamydospora]